MIPTHSIGLPKLSFFARFVLAAVALLGMTPLAGAAWGQRIAVTSGEGLYPRMIRVSHDPDPSRNGLIVASVTSFPGGRGEEQIYSSSDNGASFSRLASINDPEFAEGLCCGTLYELPAAVGALRAGTLLWAGSVGGDTPGKPMRIKIYRSLDRGATWSYLSNCATGTKPRSGGGLWEPEFTIAANGALVCFYSDETVSGFSQLIHQVQSTDGINWSAPVRTIASGVTADRPGMVVVRKLPSGRYFMTHELCGPAACTVFYKTSADGIDWTPATDVGTRVETADHQWFLHTPTNAWSPVPGTANGRIFVIGQILSGPGGTASGNGRTMFYNDSPDGSGPWKTLKAPVTISNPAADSNVCQNYSSPLLPSADGRSVLGLASDYDTSGGARTCRTFFATASAFPMPTLSITAADLAVRRGQSGMVQVQVAPGGDYRGSVRLSVTAAGFSGTMTFSSDTLTFADGAAQNSTLTIAAPQTAAIAPRYAQAGLGGAMLLVLAIGLVGRRRPGVLAASGLALALGLSGCGGDGGSSGTSAPPTTAAPPTSYKVTVTATDTADATLTTQSTFTMTVS